MENIEIINPDDKDYYDGKLYKVGIWPGAGYELIEFYVYAGYEEEALNLAVADAEINAPSLLLDFDSVRNDVFEYFDDEYREWRADNNRGENEFEGYDDDWFEFAQEYMNYIYVDATTEGASQPYFIRGENLVIEEVQDKVQENKEEIPYDNTTIKECPKCHKKYTQFPAVSRRDNKTYICPQCGVDEAIEDMLKNKKDENKEIKTEEDTNNQHYIAKCTLFDNTTEIPNTYLLLDEKNSDGQTGLDIILADSIFKNLMYNSDYEVKDLEIVKTVSTLTELVEYMKTQGEDLSAMVTDKGIPVGFGDMLPEDLNHYIIGEEGDPTLEESRKVEKINDYEYVIYRQRLTKSPIYVKDYSTETENKDEAITFSTEHEAEEYRDELELSYKEQYKIGVKNLDENKEIKKEIATKKFDGGYLNVVMENITEQEFWDYIQDIESTLEGETYVGEPATVAWYDGVYQREIYSLDDTENASKFVYYSSEYNEDTNETLYTIYEFPEGPNGGKTLKKEDYDISDIVWEDFEKYSQEEINEIRDILNNLDVVAINNDGHSVAVKIKSNDMIFWLDFYNDGPDIVGDWNQYMFSTLNSEDRIRRAIQTSYYESTGDVLAFGVMESEAISYLLEKGIIKDSKDGYVFTQLEENKEIKKENKQYNLKNIFDNISKTVDYALAESFYKVFENDVDDNGNIKLSEKEIQSKLSDFLKQHKEDYQIDELKQLINSNFDLETIKTEATEDDIRLYELIYIIKGSLDETVAIDLGQEIVNTVRKYAKSVNITGDPNGFVKKSALTYPIQNEEDGYYFDEHFMTSKENGQKILTAVKNVEGVIKALLFDLTNLDNTKLENKQIKESKFDKLSKKMAQKGKKIESLLKEDKQFPITLKNANVIDFKGIPVEIIYNFDSVQEMVNIYVEQTGKSIDVLNKEEIDYNLINTDFSHSTLTKYELIKENENKFYIIEELWGAGDEIGATLYLSNEEIKTTDINDLILQADEASRATLHKQESLLKETNYTFLSPQTIGDYSNGTIEAQSVVNCKDAEDCKNKAKKFKVDVETVEPGESGYIATMKGNLQDICNFIAGKKVNMYDFMKDENTSVMLFKENKTEGKMSELDIDVQKIENDFERFVKEQGYTEVDGDVVNEYFTELFDDIEDEEDMYVQNEAEQRIRQKYNLSENNKVEEDNDKESKNLNEELTSDEAKQKFIDFCEGKVKDLGTIDAKDGNTYKILLTSDSYKQAQPVAYLTQDDDYLIVIDKSGEVVINSNMDTIMTDIGELDFTAIDTELYNEILDNWEDYDLADDFTYRADADIQYDKIIEMAKQLPAEIKYNTFERIGGVDVEMYVDNMPNIKASTTTMKGIERVQDSFDIDGLWEVATLDENGEFDNYDYVTGWQEAVKLMQEQMPKVKKENKELQEDVNEEVTPANIKQKAQEILPAEDIETHGGDLYIKVSDKSKELINKMKDKDSGLLKTFTSEVDGQQWYDIPFANMNDDYNKLNEAQNDILSVELNTGVLPIVDVDMYSLSEELNNYNVTQEQLDEIAMELAPEYIENTLSEILTNVSVIAKSVYHPSQYNYSGDELEFTLNVSKSSFEHLKEESLNTDEFDQFLKNNYSTRSGFISYMADSIDEFERQDEWKQVVQIIMYNVPQDTIQENNDNYMERFLERVSMDYASEEIEESKSLEEASENNSYYDIHIVEDEDTQNGYSVFIKTDKHYDENTDRDLIMQEAIKQGKLDADEVEFCDNVTEIDEVEYNKATSNSLNEALSKKCQAVIRNAVRDEKEFGAGNCDDDLLKTIIEDLDSDNIAYDKDEVEKYFYSICESNIEELDERLFGPSDDVVADSKAKGLYTEAQEDKDLDVVNYNITDGGYKNNATTTYGKLSDGTYFVYYTEMGLVEIYDCELDELIDILYSYPETDEDEQERANAYIEFYEQHNVDSLTDGPLYNKIANLYNNI